MSDPALETDDDFPRNRAEAALMAATAQDVVLGIAFERAGHPFPRDAADARIALFGHLRRLSRESRETEMLITGLEAVVNWATQIIKDERDAIAETMEDLEAAYTRSSARDLEKQIEISRDEIELREQFLDTAAQMLSNIRN